MKKFITLAIIAFTMFSCSTDEIAKNEPIPPIDVEIPTQTTPDGQTPTCECYMYVPMGGNWYGKIYYCNQSTTNMVQLSTPPSLGIWICP